MELEQVAQAATVLEMKQLEQTPPSNILPDFSGLKPLQNFALASSTTTIADQDKTKKPEKTPAKGSKAIKGGLFQAKSKESKEKKEILAPEKDYYDVYQIPKDSITKIPLNPYSVNDYKARIETVQSYVFGKLKEKGVELNDEQREALIKQITKKEQANIEARYQWLNPRQPSDFFIDFVFYSGVAGLVANGVMMVVEKQKKSEESAASVMNAIAEMEGRKAKDDEDKDNHDGDSNGRNGGDDLNYWDKIFNRNPVPAKSPVKKTFDESIFK